MLRRIMMHCGQDTQEISSGKKKAVIVLASVNKLIVETMVLVITTARSVKELSHMRGFNYTIKQSQTDRID